MRYFLCLLLNLCLCHEATAGVMPSRSRIIYTPNNREQSLMLANTNTYPVVAQTWVDNGEGTPDINDVPFVSIPSVFRLEPHGIKGVRIIYNAIRVPQDRESLYWLNIYEIPPEKKDAAGENSVLITMNTQIKVFYRPQGINETPEKALPELTCRRNDNKSIVCHNPSPIHLSVIAVKVHAGTLNFGGRDADLLIRPFSDKVFHFNQVLSDSFSIEFRYINDAGEQHTFLYSN